jgi:hypothetical protein
MVCLVRSYHLTNIASHRPILVTRHAPQGGFSSHDQNIVKTSLVMGPVYTGLVYDGFSLDCPFRLGGLERS